MRVLKAASSCLQDPEHGAWCGSRMVVQVHLGWCDCVPAHFTLTRAMTLVSFPCQMDRSSSLFQASQVCFGSKAKHNM